jgi:hypothetical protein
MKISRSLPKPALLSARSAFLLPLSRLLFVSSLLVVGGCAKKQPAVQPQPEVDNSQFLADDTPIDVNFSVSTMPQGASVKLSSGETCQTPCSLTKKNTDNFDLTIEKRGYKSTKINVVSTARVVPGSGATGHPIIEKPHLSPNPVNVVLEPTWHKR